MSSFSDVYTEIQKCYYETGRRAAVVALSLPFITKCVNVIYPIQRGVIKRPPDPKINDVGFLYGIPYIVTKQNDDFIVIRDTFGGFGS